MIPRLDKNGRQLLHDSVYKLPQNKVHTDVYLKIDDIIWDPRVYSNRKPMHRLIVEVHNALRERVKACVYTGLFSKIEHHSWNYTHNEFRARSKM
jgi:hypothetical protein